MYITFDKETKRVSSPILEDTPLSFTSNLMVAEVDKVPEKYDYLTVENIQEHSRVVKEAYTEEVVTFNEETGEETTTYVKHPEETETYYTCDLKACFNPQVYTQKILRLNRIAELKKLLEETDYIAIKYAEGWLSEEEYSDIKALRQSYRNEINDIERTL